MPLPTVHTPAITLNSEAIAANEKEADIIRLWERLSSAAGNTRERSITTAAEAISTGPKIIFQLPLPKEKRRCLRSENFQGPYEKLNNLKQIKG
jgi:hypothetical protein